MRSRSKHLLPTDEFQFPHFRVVTLKYHRNYPNRRNKQIKKRIAQVEPYEPHTAWAELLIVGPVRDFTLALIKRLTCLTKSLLVQATREFTSAAIFGGDVMTSNCVGRSVGMNQSLVSSYNDY